MRGRRECGEACAENEGGRFAESAEAAKRTQLHTQTNRSEQRMSEKLMCRAVSAFRLPCFFPVARHTRVRCFVAIALTLCSMTMWTA